MKKINKTLWLATLSLTFVACQNEDITTSEQTGEQGKGLYTLQCSMNNEAQSRAGIITGNQSEYRENFIWHSGDQFAVYNQANIADEGTIKNIFTIDDAYSDLNAQPSANFSSATPLIDGSNVIAIYPAQNYSINNGNINLSIDSHLATSGANFDELQKQYLAQNMFMYASTTINGDNNTLTFQHLCAMIRITYTNATNEAQVIKHISLSTDNGTPSENELSCFASGTSFNLNTRRPGNNHSTSSSCELMLTNNKVTIAPKESRDFYMLTFPGDNFTNDGELYVITNYSNSTISAIPVSSIVEQNYGENGFKAGKRYWFEVTQTKEGLTWSKNVSQTFFDAVEISTGLTFDRDGNGAVDVTSTDNIAKFESITHLDITRKNLTNLDGVEYLTNLEILECGENKLEALDVSNNTKLIKLRCDGNLITELKLNPQLMHLECTSNPLMTLDLTQNIELVQLGCAGIAISELNVRNNPNLRVLECEYNSLKELDVSQNPLLTTLSCYSNSLSALNVTQNPLLEFLNCGENSINELNITQNTELITLFCENNVLGQLNISQNQKLVHLSCNDNSLTSLDLTNNPALEHLGCSGNSIEQLTLSNNINLADISCGGNQISELKLDNNVNLTSLLCGANNLTELNVTNNTELTHLSCENNPIADLDVSQNTKLTHLSCAGNAFTTLDITKNTSLQDLVCVPGQGLNSRTLILTSAQKVLWDNSWEANNHSEYATVILEVKD